MDVAPVTLAGQTLVPVRFVADALGADVSWNAETSEVTVIIDGQAISFAIGEVVAGTASVAQIIEGRTMLTLDFFAQNFGVTINVNVSGTIEILK